MTDPRQPKTPEGLLVIDKPRGPTSMSVCRVVKACLRKGGAPKSTKVGHGGTLDPLATGVVVVLVGRAATRLCDQIMAGEKRYTAEVDLAHRSTTDDLEGELTEISVLRAPSLGEVRAACEQFLGVIEQVPPAHSAIWVAGERAYDLARAGRDPELKARPVTIHSIDILEYAFPRLTLDVRCGKGTYIRSLARDIGRAVAAGGMLAGLRRTAVGEFTIEEATALDAVPSPLLPEHLRPVPAPMS
ncbi:MAG TPA: tRNA pseudouridine(55) synthase TruB [Phycisphaerales bacterium]|nr:tRNA pseudouridine(55) synthase TruB [Phycisphaerales bacterium]